MPMLSAPADDDQAGTGVNVIESERLSNLKILVTIGDDAQLPI
jgi:hypothetical protein